MWSSFQRWTRVPDEVYSKIMMMMNKIRTRIKTRMSRRNEDEDYNEKGGDGEGVGNLVHWIRRKTSDGAR